MECSRTQLKTYKSRILSADFTCTIVVLVIISYELVQFNHEFKNCKAQWSQFQAYKKFSSRDLYKFNYQVHWHIHRDIKFQLFSLLKFTFPLYLFK